MESGLTTTAVSVNVKEGTTQKENYMSGNRKERIVGRPELKPGSTTTTTGCHSRRLLQLRVDQVASYYIHPRRWNKETKPPPGRNKTDKSGKRQGNESRQESLPLVLAALRPLKLALHS